MQLLTPREKRKKTVRDSRENKVSEPYVHHGKAPNLAPTERKKSKKVREKDEGMSPSMEN